MNSHKVTCRREGDEVVIRIPVDFPAPVIAAITAASGVSGGWVVLGGATSEIRGLYVGEHFHALLLVDQM